MTTSRRADARSADKICDDLVAAAMGRSLSRAEAWNHGWAVEKYRRSAGATIQHDKTQGVSLTPDAVARFEHAVDALSRNKPIRELYDLEELWGVAASMIGTLPLNVPADELSPTVAHRLSLLLHPPSCSVTFPVSNIDFGSTPIEVGPLLLGTLSDTYLARVEEKTGQRLAPLPGGEPWWLRAPSASKVEDGEDATDVIRIVTFVGREQLQKAIDTAEQAFNDLTALALAMEIDLDARSLYSLRGSSHRPGLRGIVIDRHFLSRLAKRTPDVGSELAATILLDGLLGRQVIHHW